MSCLQGDIKDGSVVDDEDKTHEVNEAADVKNEVEREFAEEAET